MKEPDRQFKPGQEVVYTALFLCSIGTPPTGDEWRMRGRVTREHPSVKTLVYVDWQDGLGEKAINRFNIAQPISVAATEIPIWYHGGKKRNR